MKATKQQPGQFRRTGKFDKEPPAMRKVLTMQEEVNYHLARTNRTLDDEFFLILKKESTLPTRLRTFVLSWYEFQHNQQQANQHEEAELQTENTDDVRGDVPDELHPGTDTAGI